MTNIACLCLEENVSNKPVNSTTSGSKPLTRTKLPNFAAIHQKQFQKMENVVDHINRKQERSQILINSATKFKPGNIFLFYNEKENIFYKQ